MSQTMLMPVEMVNVDDCLGKTRTAAFLTEIEERFRQNPHLAVRSVSCRLYQGGLVLRGQVPTFYVKQIVLSIVRSVCPRDEILDLIEVSSLGRSTDFGLPGRSFRKTLPAKAR